LVLWLIIREAHAARAIDFPSMLTEVAFLRPADLFQIVAGTSFVVSRPLLLHCGQQQANEYCDDRDNDKRFCQRESALVESCRPSGRIVFHNALLCVFVEG